MINSHSQTQRLYYGIHCLEGKLIAIGEEVIGLRSTLFRTNSREMVVDKCIQNLICTWVLHVLIICCNSLDTPWSRL